MADRGTDDERARPTSRGSRLFPMVLGLLLVLIAAMFVIYLIAS